MMRRGAVMAWLQELGFSSYEIRSFFDCEKIKPVKLRKNARAYYHRDQIQRDVLGEFMLEAH